MQRFWDKVEKTDTCWNWVAANRGKTGYGCFKFKGKVYDSHRFVWFLTYGVFSTEWILHHCDNRKCVRPEHLYEGTPKENVRDMWERNRRILKPHGQGNKYAHGCRCDLCRKERMDYQREWRKRKRTCS